MTRSTGERGVTVQYSFRLTISSPGRASYAAASLSPAESDSKANVKLEPNPAAAVPSLEVENLAIFATEFVSSATRNH